MENPPPGSDTLAEHLLALIGVALPANPAADPASASPPGGMAPGRAPAGTAGTLALPSLAQPGGPVDPHSALAAGNALPLQAPAVAGGTDLSSVPPLPALDGAGGAAMEAGLDTSASLAAGQAATPARAPAPVLPTALAAPLPMPADPDAGFDDGLGARIGWLAGQQIGRAEIRLNPEQLGVIDIRLDLDGNRVSVELASASQDVRQALEASLARLREMLGQQGLDLARADVGSGQGDGGAGGHPSRATGTPGEDATESTGPGTGADTAVTVRRHGLLDEYA